MMQVYDVTVHCVFRHMRTHARYEVQHDSASSMEEAPGPASLDSPLSVRSGLITSSRSVSSESAEPPFPSPSPGAGAGAGGPGIQTFQTSAAVGGRATSEDTSDLDRDREDTRSQEQPDQKPPSPMDTQEGSKDDD